MNRSTCERALRAIWPEARFRRHGEFWALSIPGHLLVDDTGGADAFARLTKMAISDAVEAMRTTMLDDLHRAAVVPDESAPSKPLTMARFSELSDAAFDAARRGTR